MLRSGLDRLVTFIGFFCVPFVLWGQLRPEYQKAQPTLSELLKKPMDNAFVKQNEIGFNPIDKLRNQNYWVEEACKAAEVRLDRQGYSMYGLPEIWQGESSTCYAHASAQLYDAYRNLYALKKGEKIKPSSIAHISYLSKKYDKKSGATNFYGGNSKTTLDVLKSHPPCPMQTANLSQKNALVDVQEQSFQKTYTDLATAKKSFSRIELKDSAILKNHYKDICDSNPFIDTNKQVQNFIDIKKVIEQQDIFSMVDQSETFNCEKPNKAPTYKTKISIIDSKNRSSKTLEIMKVLSRGADKALPVQLSFCVHRAYIENGNNQNCGHHAVVIMGKRFNKKTNKCEFLIQDSSWPADKESSTVKKDNKKSQKLWISTEQVMRHAYRFTTIEPDIKAKTK